MKSHYGRIDLDRMPPRERIRSWEREARRLYDPEKEPRTFERFRSDYVWGKIADWQEENQRETTN